MPNSPKTSFEYSNSNEQVSTPTIGVSHVLARTTKGKFNDPGTLIRSLSSFQSIYGSEIVPDGSISNIEKALAGGSMVRVCRVPGNGIAKAVALSAIYNESGVITNDGLEVITGEVGDSFRIMITLGDSVLTTPIKKYQVELIISVRSKEYGVFPNWLMAIKQAVNGYFNVSLYNNINRITDVNASNLIETTPIALFKTQLQGQDYIISNSDISKLSNLLNNTASNNLEFVLTSSNYIETIGTANPVITNLGNVPNTLTWLEENSSRINKGKLVFGYGDETTMGQVQPTDQGLIYLFDGGSAGVAPTAQQWVDSMDYITEYTEAYQLTLSHLDQHLVASDAKIVHAAVAAIVNSIQEVVYYIGIPKYNTAGIAMNDTELKAWVQDMILTVGYSKYVAYFGGGYKYYNSKGVLKDCDNIGTVLGLGDSAAASFGPWFHFSGMNRGIVKDCVGPVSPNYGSPSKYEKLNALANSYINMSVIKDTKDSGKQTMLYHNFTSQVEDNSEKFLGIVRLNLYLKKMLRPILESYLEEPNTFNTWFRLYNKVKPKLDDLKGSAITEYTWYGDQDATKYSDLQVNNEADVRNGKYRAKLVYKDIVALQEISMELSIDAVNATVNINLNNN